MSVLLDTTYGDLVLDLHHELCPSTCKNFIRLCKLKHYNNCLFTKVVKDFLCFAGESQGEKQKGSSESHVGRNGCAQWVKRLPEVEQRRKSKTKTKSQQDQLQKFPTRFLPDEIRTNQGLTHKTRGVVAMASEQQNSIGSNFYIQLSKESLSSSLDGGCHTIFAEIAEGQDVLERINNCHVDHKEKPYQNIRIKHTEILFDPWEEEPEEGEEKFKQSDSESSSDYDGYDSPSEILDQDLSNIIQNPDIAENDEGYQREQEERVRKAEARAQAATLELLGDLPDSELSAPENVLFIAQLNSITQDQDLALIFSRFGHIRSCEIIRDYKTGESLNYAFIEFENIKDTEQAYIKMQGKVIDGKRIVVNFSQSVAKQYQRSRGGKGGGKGGFSQDELAKLLVQESEVGSVASSSSLGKNNSNTNSGSSNSKSKNYNKNSNSKNNFNKNHKDYGGKGGYNDDRSYRERDRRRTDSRRRNRQY